MNQVVRPIIPYRGPIPFGLQEGKIIEIQGVSPIGADSFAINLQTGLDPQSDRALHLSVRFHGRAVVRNALIRNAYGREERVGIFPFNQGQEFNIKILVERHAYRIAVNERHCWEFSHRIPIERVHSMFIEGHVQIHRIDYQDKYQPTGGVYPAGRISPAYDQYQPSGVYPAVGISPAYEQYPQPGVCGGIAPISAYPTVTPGVCVMPGITPTPAYPSYPIVGPGIGTGICPPPEQICPQPPQPAFISTGNSNLAPVFNPTIPYAYPIYGGLKVGMTIFITGRPTPGSSRMTFNLQAGTSPYPPADIAFHLDVRMHSRSVHRNSRQSNVWEREESITPHFPYRHGERFELIIRVDPDRYMVAHNHQHYVEFRHRLHPLGRFDTLFIENDVDVESIRFQ
jgi:hypothetical protein